MFINLVFLDARQKLSEQAIWAAVTAGAVVGAVTSSWFVFVLVSGGLIASGIMNSEIRLGPTSKGRRRKN